VSPDVAATVLPRLTVQAKLRLVAEILAFYGPALMLLRTGDLQAMVARARAVTPRQGPPDPALARALAARLGKAVSRTLSVLPTDGRCLIRAIVLTRLLACRSIQSTLVIGVQSEPFAAHAWVEHDGLPVLPKQTFVPLTEL
jgi:hypothetical protein